MFSGPVGGLCYMSYRSGENGNLQKAKGSDLCSMSYGIGIGTVFLISLLVGASQRMTAM